MEHEERENGAARADRDAPTPNDAANDETPEPPAPPPPPDVPVAGPDRIRSLDVLRGVAVLGILLINAMTFALPFPAAMNPHLEGFDEGADRWVYAFVNLFAYTKMMPVFSMLFGAGVILFTQRVEARGGRSGRRWFARQWWLLVIGMLHGYLLWNGDILVPYAVVGLILYLFRRRRPRTLIILAVIAMIVPKLTMTGFSYFMEFVRDTAVEAQALQEAGEELTRQQEQFLEIWTENGNEWNPDTEEMAAIGERMRGDWAGIMKKNGTDLFFMHLFMYPLGFGWNIAGFMLIGMALFKWGVMQGRRSDRFYVTMALVCYGLGLSGAVYGMRFMGEQFDDFIVMMRYGFMITEVSGPTVALGHIALVVLAAKRGWFGALERALAAAGRMAFTNYLAQTVIGVFVFYGFGLGLWGTFSRLELLGFTVAVWVVQLAWSPWWLARFRFGPAEWLWRTLTYGRGQPLRRRPPAAPAGAVPAD